ncbi:hypothetical protein AX14_003805 [Amanita brunnescens Koide BX004]|nr:hypothetical protein AX14_003805 [Amanita brunnescens Koide BX004]
MAKLRRDTHDSLPLPPPPKHLRIVASGTLFLTHTLTVPAHPAPSSAVRARSIDKSRGGSANIILSLLAQFSGVEVVLIAPLGGNDEARMVANDLEREGVNIHYCKVWPNAGVPSAWVIHSEEGNTRTVINHNPLPDITHEDFVSILGPLLAPENYPQISPSQSPTLSSHFNSSSSTLHPVPFQFNPNSPAPFDWLHFEGRSVKTTLNNMTGLDGLARERKWRSFCVFSVDMSRRGRQGVEALMPHADVLFVSKQYAQSVSPQYAASPRAFLLSLTSNTAPHALIVAHWGSDGAAVLSVPTREYFQSSGWVEDKLPPKAQDASQKPTGDNSEFLSVRSGSAYWADGRSRTTSSYSGGPQFSDEATGPATLAPQTPRRGSRGKSPVRGSGDDEDDNDSQGTETPGGNEDGDVMDEVGSQDAFIAGMIYALSRKLCPGHPYTPITGGEDKKATDSDRARWRLDECLRFATELAGRKARRHNWDGLADEMIRAGWFD